MWIYHGGRHRTRVQSDDTLYICQFEVQLSLVPWGLYPVCHRLPLLPLLQEFHDALVHRGQTWNNILQDQSQCWWVSL